MLKRLVRSLSRQKTAEMRGKEIHTVITHCCLDYCITKYGSTLYIGMAMV